MCCKRRCRFGRCPRPDRNYSRWRPNPAIILRRRTPRSSASLGIATDIPLLGSVAAFTPDKGQEILVRALATVRVQFPDCQLLLVGEGPCGPKLRQITREEGLDGYVHFAAPVEDLHPIFSAIDLFAFPAQAEALGTALLSAMAHGLPVVSFARGGIPEAVKDQTNGAAGRFRSRRSYHRDRAPPRESHSRTSMR